MRCIGTVEPIGPVDAGVTLAPGAFTVPGVELAPPGATAAGAVVVDASVLGAYRLVARTTAFATSSMLGGLPPPSPVGLPRDAWDAGPGDVEKWDGGAGRETAGEATEAQGWRLFVPEGDTDNSPG